MTDPTTTGRQFDLRPDPRILPMLGEINLSEIRCIAELVDNAIDAFVDVARGEQQPEIAEVHLTIPTTDAENARVAVTDTGPGMDAERLEKAVRAGWSGNDPLGKLGIFGMGFNIATARLGGRTQVWTTRKDGPEWVGVEIDFDQLIRQDHFQTPMLTRTKVDPGEHGTEVRIERLKPDRRAWLARPASRAKIAKEFGVMYASMLRPNGVPVSFGLVINRQPVRGREHCIWGSKGSPERLVTTKFGEVGAFQSIDRRLSDRKYCVRDWQWIPVGEERCPICGSTDDVIERQRWVRGWLGIQRYLHENNYGIDFIRHGRKIEIANKDLFEWKGKEGDTAELEYPIDDPRHRGRIVGEIHIDHCRVAYTKDRFDRNDPAWDEMVTIVRGEGPLRPDKAADLGYGANSSPLFRLFQAFRRSTPKPKVAGAWAKILAVPDNSRAEEMAKYFYEGDPEYQTDTKWWELVEQADRELLVGPPQGDGTETVSLSPAVPVPDAPAAPEVRPAPPIRIPIPSLTQEYVENYTRQRWDVEAFQVTATDPVLEDEARPWILKATPNRHQFFVNSTHPVFRSATLTPLDGLLSELAWSAMDFQRGAQRGSPSNVAFATVLAGLREHYAKASLLDPIALSNEAEATLNAIARSLSRNVKTPDDSRALFDELPSSEQEAIEHRMATRSVRNPQQLINEGRFLEYAPVATLLRFFESHPELFFDGRYWDVAYSTLEFERESATQEAQAQKVRYYTGLLTDATWLAQQDPSDLAEESRDRLMRAALAVDLLASNVVESET